MEGRQSYYCWDSWTGGGGVMRFSLSCWRTDSTLIAGGHEESRWSAGGGQSSWSAWVAQPLPSPPLDSALPALVPTWLRIEAWFSSFLPPSAGIFFSSSDWLVQSPYSTLVKSPAVTRFQIILLLTATTVEHIYYGKPTVCAAQGQWCCRSVATQKRLAQKESQSAGWYQAGVSTEFGPLKIFNKFRVIAGICYILAWSCKSCRTCQPTEELCLFIAFPSVMRQWWWRYVAFVIGQIILH